MVFDANGSYQTTMPDVESVYPYFESGSAYT